MIVMERTTGVVMDLTDSALAFHFFIFFIPLSFRYLDTYIVYCLKNARYFSQVED